MKKLFVLFAFCSLLVGCDKEDGPAGSGITIDASQRTIELGYTSGSATVRFTAHEDWEATVSAEDTWCSINPKSGTRGNASLNIGVSPNQTREVRTAVITLTAGEAKEEITVTQACMETLVATPDNFQVATEGDEIEFTITASVEYECAPSRDCRDWIELIDSTPGDKNENGHSVTTFRYRILPIEEGLEVRTGTIIATDNRVRQVITVVQGEVYTSTDFSRDGEVIELQKATEGKGINIVLMGDAFSDRMIEDGTYEKVMNDAVDAFFSEEPYASFRDMFNIYAVIAVSKHEEYSENADTAFDGFFGEGTHVGGNDGRCVTYARKVKGIGSFELENTLIIVMMNRAHYAGTCYMNLPSSKKDYGCGLSIAYFPLGTDADMFRQLLTHEAGGHGFAKLADEYFYESMGAITNDAINQVNTVSELGWFKNVDLTSDPAEVKWSTFLSDSRYKDQGLGVFEGGNTYFRGVWRPTEESIMVHNVGGFNAPSREAIYYRIHKLAYGDEWKYDYEAFVKYDLAAQAKAAAAPRIATRVPEHFVPLHAPVIRTTPVPAE
ncbi:M64 family metallopeptidase [uncultured Alistipes sp.]|uniref:M64 family metallopeptidase n=1 Tax=uncultured Alistipes sp. TaxID=538949 RepID=UPI00260EDF91|nr:M64 family metallopeptidase [uncultured Alistipes sp.]